VEAAYRSARAEGLTLSLPLTPSLSQLWEREGVGGG